MTPNAAAVLLLCAALPVCAQQHTRNLSVAAGDPILEKGLQALYNLEYDVARRSGEEFVRKHPDNPIGHLYMAGILWWQATTELAGGNPDPALVQVFHQSVSETVDISKLLFKADDIALRSDGYFSAGMALGLQGQMRLAEGQYVGAYRSGKKAIKYLKKCVKSDPRYYDAYLGLGVFDYQVAVLPGAIKLGARMLLRGTGNAQRGLERIQLTVNKGSFSSRQAAGFLLTIYVLNEKDYAKALTLTESLRRDFPLSPYFRFIESMLLHRLGRDTESYRKAYELFSALRTDSASFGRKQVGTLCGLYGAACLERENLEISLTWLTMAVLAAERDAADKGWTAYLVFYRGMVNDLLDRREAALTDYRRALKLPDFHGTQRWAAQRLKTPCQPRDAARFMRGESL
ncbi:MAG: hypothetical protein ABIJ96_08720 [Elusimicrobiota bacterium]